MLKTKNFSLETDKYLQCQCGHKDCDKPAVLQVVLNAIQKIRDDLGEPMTITSGGRCKHHPNEIYKSKPGDHQKCYAVDVKCRTKTLETKLKVLAGRHGATRVAGSAEDGFVHLAFTPTTRTDVPTWLY